MSKPTGNKSAAPRKGGGSMFMGVLVGMVVGVALAAGLAWFIMRSPSPFVNKEQAKPIVETVEKAGKAVAEVAKPALEAAQPKVEAASGVDDSKPRFEFYKVLTDKQDTAAPAEVAAKVTEGAPKAADPAQKTADKPKTDKVADKPAEKPVAKAADNKAAPARANFLQAGSFANSSDAENLKASLAMKGMEASVQDVSIPGKGVWHRVRVGPFASEKDMNSALGTLKLNGMDATPTH
jgi:cell division protein FtsN